MTSDRKQSASTTTIKRLTSNDPTLSFILKKNQVIAMDLAEQMQTKPHLCDPSILKKYHVEKYVLTTLDQKAVECWHYDEKSSPTPIYEDQGIKRGLSLLQAARNMFKESKRSAMDLAILDKCEENFLELMTLAYKAKIDATFALVEFAIEKLLNNIGFAWQGELESKDSHFQQFYKELFARVEKPPFAPYRTHNIFEMNTHLKVRSVQYYDRGTQPVKTARAESKRATTVMTKNYFSSHYRGDDHIGLSNFIAYSHGILNPNKNKSFFSPTMADSGFRHASFVPIDLYEEKKNDTHLRVINITTQNIDSLFDEARVRTSLSPDVKMNGVYVGLLSVEQPFDKEHQTEQYRDTVLSADRLRSREGSNQLIVFNFGVNWAAVGHVHATYPDDQEFENRRAFFQFQQLLSPKFEKMRDALRGDKSPAGLALYRMLCLFSKAMDEVLFSFQILVTEPLDKLAKAYDLACNEYISTGKGLEQVLEAEENLVTGKKKLFPRLKKILADYKDLYSFDEVRLAIEAFKKAPKEAGDRFPEKQIETYHTLLDFVKINELFLKNDWQLPKNNGVLQASILDLTNRLQRNDETIFSSASCKSGNDRTLLVMTKLDAMRAKRVVVDFDAASHCVGHASVQSAILDTDGGGPKISDSQYPASKFAAALTQTGEALAGHKLVKKYTANDYSGPKSFSFDLSRAELILEIKEDQRMFRWKELERNIPEIVGTALTKNVLSVLSKMNNESVAFIHKTFLQLEELLKNDGGAYVSLASQMVIAETTLFDDYAKQVNSDLYLSSADVTYYIQQLNKEPVKKEIGAWKTKLLHVNHPAIALLEAHEPQADLFAQFMQLDAIQSSIDLAILKKNKEPDLALATLKLFAIEQMQKIADLTCLEDAYKQELLKESGMSPGLSLS